jgi:hypothetical protein
MADRKQQQGGLVENKSHLGTMAPWHFLRWKCPEYPSESAGPKKIIGDILHADRRP